MNHAAECQYSGEWGDCDPFKMIRMKEERLISGGASCPDRKNISRPCSRDDFPPGNSFLAVQKLNNYKLTRMERLFIVLLLSK